jgi:hypothetical protein
MLLGVLAANEADVTAAAGTADLVLVRASKPADVKRALKNNEVDCVGVLVDNIDVDSAAKLRDAGATFAIAAPESTVAAAVGVEEDDYVPSVTLDADEPTLRALGGIQPPAVCVEGRTGLTVADQLGYVRLSGLVGAPLLVLLDSVPDDAELRVLRDSGAAAIVAAAGTSADDLAALDKSLRALPARKRRGGEGAMPLVPMARPAMESHEHEDPDWPDEE